MNNEFRLHISNKIINNILNFKVSEKATTTILIAIAVIFCLLIILSIVLAIISKIEKEKDYKACERSGMIQPAKRVGTRQITPETLAEYLCSSNNAIDVKGYAAQIRTIYGRVFDPDIFENIMFDELVEIESERIKQYGPSIAFRVSNAETLITEYSEIAFKMAQKGYLSNRVFICAVPLSEMFYDFVSSDFTNRELKERLRKTISETGLDLEYASGNSNAMSVRMSQFV